MKLYINISPRNRCNERLLGHDNVRCFLLIEVKLNCDSNSEANAGRTFAM